MNIQPKQKDAMILSGRGVTAVLGPTNTGKTHLAIERMVAHSSGIIGLPLRLLAREVYGRVAEKVGVANVALITGEEKIQPPGARYSVCTVEALPRETKAAFVAIDEVQLAGDLERGHIFTDRILHLRGRDETLLLGAGTMRGILERTLRGISVVTRPRMSHLAYAGSKKITRLPRRSAIVAFSADEVYAIGELIRRQRGGVAVVLGALSPRTRNKQVELYQSGDVDFLVATDAIGMGLNLDVDHVAFAQNRKFDGYQYRELTAAELGQIAGRAGRHVRDGTFGVTGQVLPFEDELVERIESHAFDPVKVLQWRTPDFDFSSLEALRRSIEAIPTAEGLTKALPAVDAKALEHLSADPLMRDLATGAGRVAMLWDACALPDYRRIAPAQHADLIGSIYQDLVERGHVNENYMAEQVRRADSADGDIDTLSHRIAQIRTWTFVSHRPGWLADPAHWQEKTREIEDRLSDALHERLTKRFVDRRTSVLMRRLRENTMLEAEISPAGDVVVEGHHVGELKGFRFTADPSADGEDAKAVKAAAQKALASEFETRAERFSTCANGDLALGSDGLLRWLGQPIGTLVEGEDALKPRVILLADEQLTGPARDKVAARAERYVGYQIETLLKPLVDLRNAETLTGIARGVAFRLVENFGLLNRRDVADDIKALDQEARGALRRLGIRFGAYHIFLPTLLKPAPAGLVTLLWALKNDGKDKPGFGDMVNALAAGRTSVVVDETFDKEFYRLAGFRLLGRRAVRVDILERVADLIRPALAWKPGTGSRPEGGYDGNAFLVTPQMMSILGANAADIEEILKALGYRAEAKTPAEVMARMASLDAAAAKAAAEKAEIAEAKAAAEARTVAEMAAAEPVTEEASPVSDETATAETVSESSETTEAAPDDGIAAADAEAGEAADPGATELQSAQDSDEAQADMATAAALPAEAAIAEAPPAPEALSETAAAATTSGESEEAWSAEPASRAEPAGDVSASDESTPEVGAAEPAPAGDAANEAVSAESEVPVEPAEAPKPILIWRLARNEGRPRHGGRDGAAGENRRGGRGRGGNAAPAAVAGEAAAPGEARGPRRERNRGPRENQAPKEPRVLWRADDSKPPRPPRPEGQRDGPRNEGPRRDGRPGGRDKNRPPERFEASPKRDERPGVVDPDSPFAKLAALRDQLRK